MLDEGPAVTPRKARGSTMSPREHTAALWFFGLMTVPTLVLLGYVIGLGGTPGQIVVACGPVGLTAGITVTSWYARREARAEQNEPWASPASEHDEGPVG